MSGILLQKPTSLTFSSTPYAHRRHPSAPVVVQPTHTPGIFSVKPHKPSPNRQLPSNQRQNGKSTPKPSKTHPVVRAQGLTPAPEIHDKKQVALPSTPSPQSRGRSQGKNAKEKVQTYRSASQSSIRGKHGRQPSPPITTLQVQSQLQKTPSQAEVTVIPPVKSTNLFDPFLDNSSSSINSSPPPSPTLAKPSGKLARRRQHQPPETSHTPSPTHSKAIPVPNAQRVHLPHLSRSDPFPSHMNKHPRPVPKRSSTEHDFPICDDMTEVADQPPYSPPSTPSRPTSNNSSGPRTAPISARMPGTFYQLDQQPPSPTRKGGKRHHRRVPSEGVFNMSSDEDVSSGPGGSVLNLNPNVRTLFGLGGSGSRSPSGPVKASQQPIFATPTNSYNIPRSVVPRPTTTTREASPVYGSLDHDKTGYFASSMFQNSPSPEELPDPLLL
ncbi:hypothetical protein BDZ97DRAFT_1756450 [Flammula alnicola]|nr:hypothetical protein BDZ97DRAFT_1756450 [Flammula alnicola]